MPKLSKQAASVIVIFSCMGLIYGARFLASGTHANKEAGSFARMKGNKDAPIRIVEFIDFQCPACAAGALYLKDFIEQHPDSIRLELKHYPLSIHKHAFLSARYAECAAQQGQFWPYHDLLIQRQTQWKKLEKAQPAFDRMAKDIGLDQKALKRCLKDHSVDKIIEKTKAEGRALGVRSTPTYFVNGDIVVGKKSLVLKMKEILEAGKN